MALLSQKYLRNRFGIACLVVLIGVVCSGVFYLSFVGLAEKALSSVGKAQGDPLAKLLLAFLVASALSYVFMGIAIVISGFLAWWLMRALHITKAGIITFSSSGTLTIVWYSMIRFDITGKTSTLTLALLSFAVVYAFYAAVFRSQ